MKRQVVAECTDSSMDERRQFAVLYRSFLFRVIDLQLLSASGDVRNLLAQFASLLAAYSFVLAFIAVSHFSQSTAAQEKIIVGAWGMEEFLISTTLTVAGLFTVLGWNALLPDRRDSFILDPLPVRKLLVFGGKTAGSVTALGISVVAVNVFTGLSFPLFVVPGGAGIFGVVRCFFAYWTTMAAAGLFIWLCVFALQSAAAMLSYTFFQRISGLLQIFAFFVILSLFFLTPSLARPAALSAASNQRALASLPSYWFLGLFHVLNGTDQPALTALAWRAFGNLAAVLFFALITTGFTYGRTVRRMTEQPDIAPSESRAASKVLSALSRRFLADPIERAILLFSARTLSRSREHRLVLAVYVGIAFAISLAFAKSLMYGSAQHSWSQPDVPLLIPSIVTLFFAVVGCRAVFALPYTLPANWIFRVTAVRSPVAYFSGTRKSLFILAAIPVLLASGVLYFSVWPGRPAVEHLLVLTFLAALLVQVSLRKFRKIPFACSYLPGKANLRIKVGIAGFAFLFAVDAGSDIEFWTMHKTARFAVLMGLLVAGAIWAKRRTAEFAGSPHNRVQFEDVAAAEIYALDLRRDAEYLNEEDYLNAVSEPEPRTLARRIEPVALAVVVLIAAGFGYERYGEWRDSKRFSQIGRSVDIGGQSLNLFCSGSGGPTVVMDSGGGVPGYEWNLVETGLAKITRSCWYDRAGYGWSDPSPQRRTSADVAEDLHKLLHAAGIPTPYLLVGHSVGGFNMRVFAARYGYEVAGLVLVDSADEYEDPELLPKSMRSTIAVGLRPLIGGLMRFGVQAGVMRLFDNGIRKSDGHLTLEDTRIIHALQLQAKAYDASFYEGLSRSETLAQVKAVRSLGSIPLIVLSGAKKPDMKFDNEEDAELLDKFMFRRVHITQAHLARLSTRGRQVVLDNVGHAMPTEAPEAVVGAVIETLGRATNF